MYSWRIGKVDSEYFTINPQGKQDMRNHHLLKLYSPKVGNIYQNFKCTYLSHDPMNTF